MNYETLEFEYSEGVGVLKINRPKALNALNEQVMTDLAHFLDEVKLNSDMRCLIVTGAGDKAFVAGADIKEMQDHTSDKAYKMSQTGQKVFQRFEELPMPVIAAVNGFALGGGLELALACDFMIASEKAKFGLPEVSLGLLPGYGGTQRLSRVVGKATARRMALTGDIYPAEKALQWGLVSEVVAPESLMEQAMKVAKTVASRGPRAVADTKKAINQGYDKSLHEGLQIEAELFAELFNTEDKKEGVSAFIEKRSPKFVGR